MLHGLLEDERLRGALFETTVLPSILDLAYIMRCASQCWQEFLRGISSVG